MHTDLITSRFKGMAAVNQMRHRKSYIKRYEPTQNVALWLHRMNTERQIQGWSDPQAVAEASLSLGNVALTWFVTHCAQVTNWAEFESKMRVRFGEDKQAIVARIKHRKQAEHESVQLYADDMIMMFAQSALPHALRQDALLNNLKSGLKEDVMVTMPSTVEQVIANATFLEEKSVAVSPEKLKAWEQQRVASRQDPIERLTRSMEKMSIAVANYWSRQEQHGAEPEASHYLSREEHRRYSEAPRRWRPPRYGYRKAHCTEGDISSRCGRDVFLHSAPSEVDLDYFRSTGCTPATPEAWKYAQSLDHKAETLQAARIALVKCCKVVSGSETLHTEAGSVKAAKASEAMMKTNPCATSAKTGQAIQAPGKTLTNCCAVVSGSDAVHTEARSAKAVNVTSSVNKPAEQAMPEGLNSESYERQVSNGDTRKSTCDLQCIKASEAALERTRDTGGSSVKSTAELTGLTGYSTRTKAYASPFPCSISKPEPRTIVATAPTIAPGKVHCEIEVQADDSHAMAHDEECETVLEAFGLSIQADTGDASGRLVQITEPKPEITDTTAQSLLEQLKVVQQLDEDSTSQAGFALNVIAGQHDDCSKTEAPLAVDSSVTILNGSDTHAYAGKSGGPAESSQSLSNASCDLKINADVGSVPVKVQTVLLKSLTCLDSTQVIPSPSVASDYDIACQITGKAGPRTNQFDPGKATANPQEGYGDQPWDYSANKHRSSMKEVGIIITIGQVFHPLYVSKDPDKLPQYILKGSESIIVPEQGQYHHLCCRNRQPVEVVEFLADAVHNAKAAWKQNFLKIVAKVKHCLKAVLWIRAG